MNGTGTNLTLFAIECCANLRQRLRYSPGAGQLIRNLAGMSIADVRKEQDRIACGWDAATGAAFHPAGSHLGDKWAPLALQICISRDARPIENQGAGPIYGHSSSGGGRCRGAAPPSSQYQIVPQ